MKKASNTYIILFSLWAALSIYFVSPFFLSLVMGIIFATIIYPIYEKSETYIKGPRGRALLFSILFTIFFLAPFVFIAVKSTKVALEVFSEMPQINWKNPDRDLSKIILDHPIGQKMAHLTSFSKSQIDTLMQSLIKYSRYFLATFTSQVLASIPAFVMSFVIIIGTIYACLTDGPRIARFLEDNPFFSKEDTREFFKSFSDVSYSVVLATIFCSATQAFIFMIPTLVFDINIAVVIVFVTFLCSFIPNIGTAPVAVYLVGKAALENDWTAALVYFIFAIIVALSDNVLHALFVGRRIHVHPFITFIAAIGGILTLGVYGLFIAPVVVLTLFKFYEYWITKHNLVSDVLIIEEEKKVDE